ncbi:hypothetical protein V2A60_008504 [Cordyceps javanica]
MDHNSAPGDGIAHSSAEAPHPKDPRKSSHCLAPQHATPTCSCHLVTVSNPHESESDSSKAIAVFSYRSDTEPATLTRIEIPLEATPPPPRSESRTEFIAISHVRKSGLGNDRTNALPHCQLALLQRHVDRVAGLSGLGETAPFWIDTLALPTERASRKAAEANLWRIFRQAGAVLVVDPSLLTESVAPVHDALDKIRDSAWKQRLWTLEEGFYARALFFAFCEEPLSLDELLGEFGHHSNPATARHPGPLGVLEGIRQEQLAGVLERFSADIRKALQMRRPVDKLRLYTILRAGYLSAKKFWFLIEEGELDDIISTWPKLSAKYLGQDADEDAIDGIVGKLNSISATLPSVALVGSNEVSV